MLKQAGEIQTKATLGNVLGTALNPVQALTGDVWSPLGKQFPVSSGEDAVKTNALLFQAALLAATYGGIGYLTSRLANKYKLAERGRLSRITGLAGSKYSVVSPDPITNDVASEKREEDLGLIYKQSNMLTNSQISRDLKDVWKGGAAYVRDFGKQVTPDKENLLRYALPIGAVTVALLAGTWAAGKSVSKKESKEVQGDLDMLSNQLDALNYKKLLTARGEDALAKESADKDEKVRNPVSTDTLWAAVGLVAAASAAVTAYYTKSYMDKRDVNRLRLKAVEDGLKEEALADLATAPVIIPGSVVQRAKMLRAGNQAAAEPVVQAAPEVIQPIAPAAPVAAIPQTQPYAMPEPPAGMPAIPVPAEKRDEILI